MGEAIKKTPKELKKEKIDAKRAQIQAKKSEKKLKKERKKFRKLAARPEPGQQVLRAAGGGLLGVFAVVCWTYVLWGIFSDQNILYAGAMFDQLSMGNPWNAMLGVWALSFTPLTSLHVIFPNWLDVFYVILIPLLIAGLLIALITKRIKLSILGSLFFMFWGIVLPVLSVYVLPIIGIFDPALVDGELIGILAQPMNSAWLAPKLMPIFGNNLFISWSAAGTIEATLIVMLLALVLSAPIQLLKRS